jgi:hypothetical protein
MAKNDDLRERWVDVIIWESFWEELEELLGQTFEDGKRSAITSTAERVPERTAPGGSR